MAPKNVEFEDTLTVSTKEETGENVTVIKNQYKDVFKLKLYLR